MTGRFGVILTVIVIAFGAIFFFAKDKASAPNTSGNSSVQPTSHITGNTDSKVTFVEYADFQCPACATYYPIISQVIEKYKDRVAFQFVNFPLYQTHQNAMASHRVAEAASIQGKFWEMYELLYLNQSQWDRSNTPTTIFEQYATQLGLDIEKFKQDSASSNVNDIIWADINKATSKGVTATPTFFINDSRITSTPRSLEDFSVLIDEALQDTATN